MPHFVIMGAGRVGVMLARTLEASGHTVAVIDQDERAFQPLRKGFEGRLVTGVGFDEDTLKRAGITEAYAFAAVSSGDNSNIIAARVAREMFKVKNVVARVYDPNRAEFFQRMGIPTVASVRWSTDQVLRRLLPEQALKGDFREPSGRLMLTEIPLDDGWAGHALTSIERAAGVRIAYITRFGEGMLPRPDSAYQQGDSVHVMMRTDDVADVTRIPARHALKTKKWRRTTPPPRATASTPTPRRNPLNRSTTTYPLPSMSSTSVTLPRSCPTPSSSSAAIVIPRKVRSK